MAIHVQDKLADHLVREAADRFNMGITDVLRAAMRLLLKHGPSPAAFAEELEEAIGLLRASVAENMALENRLNALIARTRDPNQLGDSVVQALAVSAEQRALEDVAICYVRNAAANPSYTTLFIDGDIISALQASGQGWEKRLNLILRGAIEKKSSIEFSDAA